MTGTFTTAFEGDKVIDGAIDHHVFTRATVDGVGRDPIAAQIFEELGSTVDPETGRSYFDIGDRADNSITVLNGANAPNGTIGQNSSHIEYSAFMRERAVADVKAAYQQTLAATNGDLSAARRAAGRVVSRLGRAVQSAAKPNIFEDVI